MLRLPSTYIRHSDCFSALVIGNGTAVAEDLLVLDGIRCKDDRSLGEETNLGEMRLQSFPSA
jgi:hypothetical protein